MACCKLMALMEENHVGKCTIEKSRNYKSTQFAAIDSHIENLRLPLVSHNDFCDTDNKMHACLNQEFSSSATLIAIIGAYSHVSNIVIFMDSTDTLIRVADIISEFRSKLMVGCTMTVRPSTLNKDEFVLKVHETSAECTVNESQMLSIASKFASESNSMIFYMNLGSVGYASVLNISNRTLWVSSTTDKLNMKGLNGMRLMPVFYDDTNNRFPYSINVGNALIDIGYDKDKLCQQLNSIKKSALNAATKNNRCYFCDFLERVHSFFCIDRHKISFSLKLTDEFASV